MNIEQLRHYLLRMIKLLAHLAPAKDKAIMDAVHGVLEEGHKEFLGDVLLLLPPYKR